MIERIGFIGVGHLASYLVEGLRRASDNIEILLSPRNMEIAKNLSTRFGAMMVENNQAIVDNTEIIMLTTRPEDSIAVADDIIFRSGQTVISVAVGLPLSKLKPVIAPAVVVRAIPISCASINQSPTIVYPDNPLVREIFTLLGQVHVLPYETAFIPASVITAFYGWQYALLDEIITWTSLNGVPSEIARNLVLETVRGVVNMALDQPEQNLGVMLDPLATPGGITEQGLKVLHQHKGMNAWVKALRTVFKRLHTMETI